MYNRMVDGFRAKTAPVTEAYRARASEIAANGYSAPSGDPRADAGARARLIPEFTGYRTPAEGRIMSRDHVQGLLNRLAGGTWWSRGCRAAGRGSTASG